MPPRSRNGQCSVLAAVMSDSEPPGHDIIAREETVRESQRLEDERSHRLLEGLARHLLDDAPEQVVAPLTVGGPGAGERDQLHLNHLPPTALPGHLPFTRARLHSP